MRILEKDTRQSYKKNSTHVHKKKGKNVAGDAFSLPLSRCTQKSAYISTEALQFTTC